MEKFRCISKFRDNKDNITEYRLQDTEGKTYDAKAKYVKTLIRNGQIDVVNLTLTSDGRLVDAAQEKQVIKSIIKSEAPKNNNMDENNTGRLNNDNEGTGKIYLWVEDLKSGQKIWSEICKEIFPNIIVEHPRRYNDKGDEVWGNGSIINELEDGNIINDGNTYIILIDQPFENRETSDLYKRAKEYERNSSNVYVVKGYLCLEAIFISFKRAIEWIEHARAIDTTARECFQDVQYFISSEEADSSIYSEAIAKFEKEYGKGSKSTMEGFLSRLLAMTTQNTGFVISKRSSGLCWYSGCCYNREKMKKDQKCDFKLELDAHTKVKKIYTESFLRKIFREGGVEDVAGLQL